MILIVCVDDDMGMLFNNRRQSQDSVLRKHILDMTVKTRLWMNHYSAKQFASDICPQISVNEDFLNEAVSGDYCFIENIDIGAHENQFERIILFKWNRQYPGDFHFNIDLSEWAFVKTFDFVGSSHEKITMEVYDK